MTVPVLSKADTRVLAQVFDPESVPGGLEILVDPSLPSDGLIDDPTTLTKLREREVNAVRIIEAFEASSSDSSALSKKKQEAYLAALACLDALIAEYPTYASARNNRAQLRRWRFGDANLLVRRRPLRDVSPTDDVAADSTDVEEVVSDLKGCITLAAPKRLQDAVSPTQGRLLAQAHTQLGALLYSASKEARSAFNDDWEVLSADFIGWNADTFEAAAARHFHSGGLYGNEVARALAVHANPAAKLCGSIVKEAMRKEMGLSGVSEA